MMTAQQPIAATTQSTRFPEVDRDQTYELLINGAWTPSLSGETFRCFDPYDDLEWGHVPVAGAEDVARAVDAARHAFTTWSVTPALTRSSILNRWAQLIMENLETLARLQVHENGKTITEMRGATGSVANSAEYFGHLSLGAVGSTLEPFMPGHEAWTLRQPIGVIAAIAPWNNPLGLLGWKLFPALAAGNTIVIKPSEITPVSTLFLARLGVEAGIPAGVVNIVTGPGTTGAALVKHPGIDKIAFTGSTATGGAIAEIAARRFLRTTLELGGKGAQIVFADADLDAASSSLVTGIVAGTGQACNAGSRLLVQRAVYNEVIDAVRTKIGQVRIGDPLDPASIIGPLASRPQFEKVTGYLDLARDEGCELIAGGRAGRDVPGIETGRFVEPTLYATPDERSRIRREEIFGPVGAVIPFDDEDDAIAIANETEYGLVAGLWTKDVSRAHRASRRLESGVVWINTWRAFSTNVPFGGMKHSGLGRELGPDALNEYTETKSIWLGVG
ncbi:aldehyde dehydrogenase family protein [Arthrobacter sp. Rue61a]|uniref:aldehyde dehydrogenase family protein n=1 Tax=Arthrobacter sp. Rue61a TaxID=1118963 RepID=UPI00027DFDBC|nr:aldehyde dehydrogenase family protein [Arthrobacter sp. Rue61a]AFR28788.1 aldehyde dehydrogenase [Arthrobacter sp. Rue61a]